MHTAMIIRIGLLSGSIDEELRSAGVWVIGPVVGKTTGIDRYKEFILSSSAISSDFLIPSYLYKNQFSGDFF